MVSINGAALQRLASMSVGQVPFCSLGKWLTGVSACHELAPMVPVCQDLASSQAAPGDGKCGCSDAPVLLQV